MLRTLAFAKDEGDLAHLDAITFGQHDRRHRAAVRIERATVDDDRIGRRKILQAPPRLVRTRVARTAARLLEHHARMRPTHGWLTELNVTIWWTVRAAKRYAGSVGATGANETNLLAGIAACGDLQATGKELQRAVRRTPEAHRRAIDGLTHLVVDREGFGLG